MSLDTSSCPDPATHSNFRPLPPLLDDAHKPLSSVPEQGGAGVLVEMDNRARRAHLERVLSPHKKNSLYVTPSGTTTNNIRSEEIRRRIGPRSPSPSRLYPPPFHPLHSHQNVYDERRRLVTNPGTTAASRPQDTPALDRLNGQSHTHSSTTSPRRKVRRSSDYAQHQIHSTSSQRGFEEDDFYQFWVMGSPEIRAGHAQGVHHSYQGTLPSPSTVPSSTPSTVSVGTPSSVRSGRTAGPRPNAVEGFHLGSGPRGLDVDRVRRSEAKEDHRADVEAVSKSQEDGGVLFSRPMGILMAARSVNGSGEATPLSDHSSTLVPWQSLRNATSSMVKQKKIQDRLTNLYIPPTKPTSRPRSRSKEGPLHCDELNVPRRNPLSKMEKALLRRIEFGYNVDFSKVQLS